MTHLDAVKAHLGGLYLVPRAQNGPFQGLEPQDPGSEGLDSRIQGPI